MRLPLAIVLILLALGCQCDWYICRAVWRRCQRRKCLWRTVAIASSVILNLLWLIVGLIPKQGGGEARLVDLMWAIFAYLTVYLPKYIFVAFDLAAKIPRLFHRGRLKWMSYTGIAAAIFVFGAMWWGAYTAMHRIGVKEVEIENNTLPPAFNGLRAVQISDLHTGTYGSDTAFISRLVETVNGLQPDVIFFTGDIVNRTSSELEPFADKLSELYAPLGVYSVLGNHDYGDYYKWPAPADKAANLDRLKALQAAMGWQMLNNASADLIAGPDTITVVGVENIGDPPFPTYGDLDAAYDGNLADGRFKILLSHNPIHWENDIVDAPDKNIALTLSGHTHAMQVEIGRWSPARWRYRYWGGLYGNSGANLLYVNTGIGEVGIPARIGAVPEVTVINFKRPGAQACHE